MQQVAQRPRDGEIAVEDVPAPRVRPGTVLVRNRFSLISAGTERSKVELGSKSLLDKARARPDLVRKVVDRARVEGVRSTLDVVRDRLAGLDGIGYSSAGVVLEVGEGVTGLAPGDRVCCGGAGWANHAELVVVPANLVARVPDEVGLDVAAYATVGAIALHGVRQAETGVGSAVGVIGLGLVGQLAVRLLGASGCVAVGIDLDQAAVDLATAGGAVGVRRDAENLHDAVMAACDGAGLDAVLICAATSSPDPLSLATELCRDRGRVVVVGDVPIEASRAVMYEKELDLRLSRSYGPGRYDRDYEERGIDLPRGYVRWSEGRNIKAIVDLAGAGRLDLGPLTTHRFAVDDAAEAYATIMGEREGPRPFGVLLEYPEAAAAPAAPSSPAAAPASRSVATDRVGVALVGAGGFARATILPALRDEGARLVAVASARGLSAADVASRFGFERTAADLEDVLTDDVDAVVIATRHADHAALAAQALRAGKAVFVEKPLALTHQELDDVEAAARESGAPLMVGFNRRFAPMTTTLLDAFTGVTDRVISARVNAGPLPAEAWLHDPLDGGGRLRGEGCHFVDLLSHLAGGAPEWVHAFAAPQPDRAIDCSDSVVATLRFAGGAVATLVYAGGGSTKLEKERFEMFGGGVSAVLEDFRRVSVYRGGKPRVTKAAQDKGHRAQFARFLAAAAGRMDAPPLESYLGSSRATLALCDSLRTGAAVAL